MTEGNRMSDLVLEENLCCLDLNLKYEQKLAVKELNSGNNVLAVFPTGIWKKQNLSGVCLTEGSGKRRGCNFASHSAPQQDKDLPLQLWPH